MGCSQRHVCRAFDLHRSTYRYQAKRPSEARQQAEGAVVDLSLEHPELGSDKIGRMVRKEGHKVSNKRVRDVRREECLQVPAPRKKRSRRGKSTGQHPTKAEKRNHVWSWDFIHDRTVSGGSIRILSLVDEYTRETYELYVDRSIGAHKLCEILGRAIRIHGAPNYIRSDNGPEFVAKILQKWLKKEKIKTLYIELGSPWQNGYVESFHDKFRRECLNREIFYTLTEARVIIEKWGRKFNAIRPHWSLGMLTPHEYAKKQSGGYWSLQDSSYASSYGLRSTAVLTREVQRVLAAHELLT